MSSIDRRVVELEFDNKQFESGIKDTLNSLEALKKGLQLDGATQGLSDVEAAGKNFNLDGMSSALDNISSKFSVLGAIGFSVIQSLTNSALDFAKRIAGSIFDPLVSGGRRRALNLEQARFQFRGLGMDVEATMESALIAVKGTAYGLDQAARAAGQFGASGMRAGDDMTSALRAISGVAAMTSSEYDDIANVFTKVAGNGRVMGDDLLRLSSRGLNAAATLADSMGITEEAVRSMVTEGQVSFEMFYKAMDEAFGENATKANETYTGSLANMRAALSRIGASFFGQFLEDQRDVFNALSPAIDAVGEALTPVISAMKQVTGGLSKRLVNALESFDFTRLGGTLFRPILNIIKNLVSAISSILGPVRDAFVQIFPPASLAQIRNILRAIEQFTAGLKLGEESANNLRRTFAGVFAVFSIGWTVVKAVVSFFMDLFGIVSEGSGAFLGATANIGDFLVALDQAIKNGEGLTNFFKGLTRVLTGPLEFIKELARAFLTLFDFDAPSVERISRSFEPLGLLGEFLLGIWDRLGEALKSVWRVFEPIAERIGAFFSRIGSTLTDVFGDLDFSDVLDTINTGLLGGLFLMVRRFAENFGTQANTIASNLTKPFQRLTWTLETMQTTLRAMTLMQIAIAVALLAGSVVALSKVDAAGLTRALTAMSVMFVQLFASLAVFTRIGGVPGLIGIGAGLILFAAAIRVLTSAVKALAELGWEDLAKGLTGTAVLIAALTVAVRGMSGHTAGMIAAGAGLLILAAGIKVLVSAVEDLSDLSWEELARGLVGVGTLLGSLLLFTRFAAVNKGAIGQGAALILLAAGIKILASAVSEFASLSWGNVAKGLVSVSAILAAFVIFSKAMGNPAGLIAAGASLVLIGAAMHILAGAFGEFADLSWQEIAKGLVSMAGALTAIVLALNLMPPTTLASAASLVAVGFALGLIADSMDQMSGMSWGEVAKALVTLAGSLAIIAAAMALMTTALPGAAATLVVAAALSILAPVLERLGEMSWAEIGKALVTLAGVFVIFGLAGLALAPVVPVLIALGAAIALVGVGMMAAGAGVLLFATGLTALAVAGAAGTAAIVALVAGLASLIPLVAKQIGMAIVILIQTIGEAGPAILEAISAILGAVLGAIEEHSPKIIEVFVALMSQLLEAMVELTPLMSDAAFTMMTDILNAMNEEVPAIVDLIFALMIAIMNKMEENIPGVVSSAIAIMVAFLRAIEGEIGKVIDAGTNIVIAIIQGISENMVRIADEGMKAVIAFVNGVANAIETNSAQLRAAGRRLAFAIADGMTGGLASKVSEVAGKARELASNAVSAVKGIFRSQSPSKVFLAIGQDVGDGLAIGLEKSGRVVQSAAGHVGEDAIDALMKSIVDLSDLFGDDIDLNPTITPVLDLDEFRNDVTQIGALLSDQMLSLDDAYTKAKDVSARQRVNASNRPEEMLDKNVSPTAQITYNQYNTSPKALPASEIYRQTKNQLSTVKGALTP